GEGDAVWVGESSDGIAVIAGKVGSGDEGDGVLQERVAVGVERDGGDIDALHAAAGAEGDRALDGDGVGSRELLAGKAGEILGGDRIDAVEGCDVVHPKD